MRCAPSALEMDGRWAGRGASLHVEAVGKREVQVYGKLRGHIRETGHHNESKLLLSEEPRLFHTHRLYLMSKGNIRYLRLWVKQKTNGKTEQSGQPEPETEWESQRVCLTESLFFFHSLIFKMEAWLQNSFAVSPVAQKVALTFSNSCVSDIECSCLMLDASLFCFVPADWEPLVRTWQYMSLTWGTGMSMIRGWLGMTLAVQKRWDQTTSLSLLGISGAHNVY